MSETVLDALLRALDQCRQYTRVSEEAPLLILWPDRERQWEALVPLLRGRMPQLLTLGPWDASTRTGPAPWVRCALVRSIEVDWPEHLPPVVYLPGVARDELRAVDECPEALAPLVGLQHRGRIWAEDDDHDWTLSAFLTSRDRGLGLDVANDATTKEALLLASRELAATAVEALRGRKLTATDFRKLLVDDPVRELLLWLDDPEGFARRRTPEQREALEKLCTQEFALDLEKDTATVAAARLCEAAGAWAGVWKRFVEAAATYPGVLLRLRDVVPPAQLTSDARRRYPKIDAAMEDELRQALASLADVAHADAQRRVLELDKRHGERRAWPWASVVGGAALAKALEHLAVIARGVAHPLSGDTPDAMAEAWTGGAWRVDLAALRACASVQREADLQAVYTALTAVYGPWLDETARRFQQAVMAHSFPGYHDSAKQALTVSPGEVLFFADGLRYDVLRWLTDVLRARGLTVEEGVRWIGMPSVTATSKHAASPVVSKLTGTADGKDFNPAVVESGKPVTADSFRKLLAEAGYPVLGEGETGDPKGRAYVEYGSLDHEGHAVQGRLASRVEEHVIALADRIEALLAAGWKRLRVVTDHGWVLLPGGLPKRTLDAHESDMKWGRCAVLKPTTTGASQLPKLPWRWNAAVTIVAAPGVGVFYKGSAYAHGGLSLHECLTPDLRVSKGKSLAAPTDVTVVWKGLRCMVTASAGFDGIRVDVRAKAGDPTTSYTQQPKLFNAEGVASVLVIDHDCEGEAAHVVLLDPVGAVVQSQLQKIGG